MIDGELITKASNYTIEKFSNRVSTNCEYLWFLQDFLYPELIEKILKFVEQDDLPWTKVRLQTYAKRQSISWIPDTVIEELHMVINNLTPQIERVILRPQKFGGISIWKDEYPYSIGPHADQPIISSALQIYLNVGSVDTTTHFKWQDKILKPENLSNHGYFLDNRGKVVHWLPNEVPKDFYRYSLYAIWHD